ncbi:glutathione S-transferase family protein [Roseovarius sp. CAU 1744]|uniref:glutathione S-transferase family protein n=1 Tax=Roseovarius sp. CAU 1744 TaxID=3140368 RepID=UPI00325BE857
MPAAGAGVVLTGYALSVYTRSARMALAEKGVTCDYAECNPFDPADALTLLQAHPFGRVPVLEHRGFRLYETAAILDYINAAFDGPALVPGDPQAAARMRQVISMVDNYVYWPLVRQAFSHGVYRPLVGEAADMARMQDGLEAAPRVLDALEEIAAEGLVLRPESASLACCHLFPMLDYFAMLPEGRELLAQRDALSGWVYAAGRRRAAALTRPELETRGGAA